MFRLPGKNWFRPQLDSAMMELLLNGARWQLVQTAAVAFELRFMPTKNNEIINKRKLQKALKEALGPGSHVTINPVAALGLASSGKFSATANLSQP
jgi:hypothetical protein